MRSFLIDYYEKYHFYKIKKKVTSIRTIYSVLRQLEETPSQVPYVT